MKVVQTAFDDTVLNDCKYSKSLLEHKGIQQAENTLIIRKFNAKLSDVIRLANSKKEDDTQYGVVKVYSYNMNIDMELEWLIPNDLEEKLEEQKNLEIAIRIASDMKELNQKRQNECW